MDASRPSFVGIFDILGFREMVQEMPIDDVRNFLTNIPQAADGTGVKAIQFSDTLLLYTEGAKAGQLESLLDAACILLGAHLGDGIGIRGGIARGEFSHLDGVFVGKAMVRAYELEQSQDWAGAILEPVLAEELWHEDPKFMQSLLDRHILVQYEAPIKGGPVGNLYCVGWPIADAFEVDVSKKHAGTNWAIMRKWANTETFRRHWNRLHQSGKRQQFLATRRK